MKNISKAAALIIISGILFAICTPVSAQATEKTTESEIGPGLDIDIFAKEKMIKSGDRAYVVAQVTDENGDPVAGKTVLFFQNIEVSGLSVDRYIDEAETDENGIAVFRPALSVDGDYGTVFFGCAAEDENGRACYSDHVLVTVTNPYPYIADDEPEE